MQFVETLDSFLSEPDMLHISLICIVVSFLIRLPSPSPVPPRGCELPWWFVYLGWLCVFLTSGLAAFFTMMYGLKMGRVQSTQWLVAMAVTLFQSIFILQPLKVLLTYVTAETAARQ